MFGGKCTLGLIGTVMLLIATVSTVAAGTGIPELRGSSRTGNVIFIHPDGAGLNHWSAARIYWYGPDGLSPWDTLPEMAAYRGHMADMLTGTSNGGATTHAFGYKVEGLGSFGKDSDAGGLQVGAWSPTANVTDYNNNPTGVSAQNVRSPLNGRYGRNSPPFLSEPDAYGRQMAFAVSWVGTPDVSGGIISRAQGLNAAELRRTFRGRFDNTDVYRLMYLTLFGTALPSAVGQTAPDR